jgi:hypothetical protein
MMVIRSRENSIGAWAFLIGVILAVTIGLSTTWIPIPFLISHNTAIYSVLLILGIIVGFVNVTGKDTQTFLLAGAVLVIVSGFGMDSVSSSYVSPELADIIKTIFGALLTLFVPATIIVALKTVFSIANL